MTDSKVLMTVPQYALHRGKDQGAVRYAIRTKKLSVSLVKDGSGGILIDRDKADQEWVPRVNPKEPILPTKKTKVKKNAKKKKTEKPDTEEEEESEEDEEFVPIFKSRAKREMYEADLARIKVEQAMGKLVIAKEVEEVWVRVATTTRTKVLGIPSKARQRMPELSDAQYGILEMIVREALEELRNENVVSDEDNE